MVTQPTLAQDTTKVTDAGTLVDFQDVDLRLVITALAEAGGLNVVYGDLPARKITLRMKQPVMRAEILPLLRSVAQANGLVLSQNGGLIQVSSATGAAGLGSISGPETAG